MIDQLKSALIHIGQAVLLVERARREHIDVPGADLLHDITVELRRIRSSIEGIVDGGAQ